MSWALCSAQKSTFFAPNAHMLLLRKKWETSQTQSWEEAEAALELWRSRRQGLRGDALCSAWGWAGAWRQPAIFFFFFEKKSGAISWFVSFAIVWTCPQRADGVGGWYCLIIKWSSSWWVVNLSESLVWQNNLCVLAHTHGGREGSTVFTF